MTDRGTLQDERPGLSEAFDWRVSQTWAAFAGSVALMGGATAIIAVIAIAAPPGMPGGVWIGFGLFMIFIGLLHGLFKLAGRELLRAGVETTSWRDVLLYTLWCGLAGTTFVALAWVALELLGAEAAGPESRDSGLIVSGAIVFLIGVGPLYVPAFLRLWGRAKEPG